MKKKTKKIPSLPKYYSGGINWATTGQSIGNVGMQLAANQDLEGEDKQRANEMAMNAAANQGLQKIPGYGQFHGLAMGASNLGRSTIAKDEKGLATTSGGQAMDNFMKPMHEQVIGDLSKGQYGEGLLSIVANKGTASAVGSLMPNTKFGKKSLAFGRGEKVFAMGGMNMMPNAEVEGNEMITSNTPPQTFGAGGVELASNNPYGTPTYKTYGPSHDNGGIPVNMTPGTVINGQTVNPLTGNKFTKDIDAVAKMENKYTKKAENGDKFAAKTANLILPVLAQKKDYLNKLQNAIIANKEQAKALRNGILPSTDNEQVEPQSEMPMAKYGGMYANGGKLPEGILKARLESHMSPKEANDYIANYAKGGIHINPANKGKFTASAERAGMGVQEFARHVLANKEDYSSTQVKRANFARNAAGWKHEMGGVQLPYYNIDSNGNPIYTMGGGYPAMTNPYHNFKGSIPMYEDGGKKLLKQRQDEDSYINTMSARDQQDYQRWFTNASQSEGFNPDEYSISNYVQQYLPNIYKGKQSNMTSYGTDFNPITGEGLTNKEKSLPKTSNQQSNPQPDNNKLNWGKIGSQVGMGLLQNAGNIYNLSRYNKPEVEKYDRIMANLLNPKAAIRDVDVEGRLAVADLAGRSGGSQDKFLANRIALAFKIAQGKERARMNYDNANAGILTDAQKFNAQIAMQEAIANAQNRARVRSGKGEDISQINENIAQQMLDTKKYNMNQKTLAMYQAYFNNPQFRAAIEKAGFNLDATT